jgi:fatty acid desaturase
MNPPPEANYGSSYNPQTPVSPVITIKQWMIMMLILIIPIVNIVMMFVWAFGEGNPTKKNYFKASLIFAAIILVLYVIIFVAIIGSAVSNMQ